MNTFSMKEERKEVVLRRFELTELPLKEEQDKAMAAIGETEEAKKKSLELLKKLIEDENDFYPCIDEDFLLRFLRNAKFDVKKAFNKLKKFYEIQRKNPAIFEFCSESALKKAYLNSIQIPPYRMKDHSVLHINNFFYTQPPDLLTKEKFYLETLIIDDFLRNPLNQICGLTLILDCSNLSFKKLFYYNPKIIKLYLDAMQGIFPVSLKAVHLVKVPSAFQILFKMGYPFLSAKLQNRLHFYSDNETFKDLHANVPPEILPEEYGGYLKDSNLINGMKNMREKEKNFRKVSPCFYSSKPRSS